MVAPAHTGNATANPISQLVATVVGQTLFVFLQAHLSQSRMNNLSIEFKVNLKSAFGPNRINRVAKRSQMGIRGAHPSEAFDSAWIHVMIKWWAIIFVKILSTKVCHFPFSSPICDGSFFSDESEIIKWLNASVDDSPLWIGFCCPQLASSRFNKKNTRKKKKKKQKCSSIESNSPSQWFFHLSMIWIRIGEVVQLWWCWRYFLIFKISPLDWLIYRMCDILLTYCQFNWSTLAT